MNIESTKPRNRALTLIEILTIVAVVGVLFALLLTWCSSAKQRSIRIVCVFDLKSTGLAASVWAGDNGGLFPMSILRANGGTKEYTTGANAFRHFQVMSNELSTPRVVLCPTDDFNDRRSCATNFANFNNSNISFFVNVDAKQTNSSTILSGDRNITNGTAIINGLLQLTTSPSAAWTSELHNKGGNILLADTSVQQVSSVGLQNLVSATGAATNLIQMPVLGP